MYLQLKSTVLEDEKSLDSLYHVDDDNLKTLYEILIIFWFVPVRYVLYFS